MGQDRFDGHGIRFAPGLGRSTDLVSTWDPDVGAAGSVGAGLLFDYASQTLVEVTETDGGTLGRQPLLGGLFASTVLARTSLHERIGLGLELPVVWTSRLRGEVQSAAVGDVRLASPVEVLEGTVGLAVIPFVDLPAGGATRLLGNGFGGGGRVAAALRTQGVVVTGNLGASIHPNASLFNVGGRPTVLASLGASVRATERIGVALEVDSRGAAQSGREGLDVPVQLLASTRWSDPNGLSLVGGVGTTLTEGAGSARFRAFLGASFSLDRGRDRDLDGVVDRFDECLVEPEVLNGFQDEDGCADLLCELTIRVVDPEGIGVGGIEVFDGETGLGTTDPDGRLLLADRIPRSRMSVRAEPPPDSEFVPAAPEEVELVEGLMEVEWAFEYRPGTFKVVVVDEEGNPVTAEVTFRGAEERAARQVGPDGEALLELTPGRWSLIIENSEYGLATQEIEFSAEPDAPFQVLTFVLKAPEVETTAEEVVLLDAVHFTVDSDALQASSLRLLDEVAANLLRYQQIGRVEVQGHTSAEGSAAYNAELSQRRMDTVVDYLVERGVKADRLLAVGYGERCPLATNSTPSGRAQNRRVQFIVLDPKPKNGVPCHGRNPGRRAEATSISLE